MNDLLAALLIFLIYFSPVFYQLGLVIKESKKGNPIPLKKLLKFFKWSVIIIIPIILLFGVLSHTNFLDYEKPLTYDKYENITFENFRGLEFFKKSLYGNERFAYVVTSIDSNIESDSVMIQSLFYPSRSFVYKQSTNSKELLKHEKYHIKITELFARKAKQEISKFVKPEVLKIGQTIEKNRIAENSYQKQYDKDTYHSYIYGEQIKYQRKIDSMLHLLKDYSKPKIKIND